MQENSPIKKRILEVIELKDITKYEFYKKSGITRGILDQNNGISEENIAKLLAFIPDINADWLLTGKGSIFENSTMHVSGSKNIIQSGGSENSAQITEGKKNTVNKEQMVNELQAMQQKNYFLEKEKELLAKENELLKREIELLNREKTAR